MSEVSSSTRSVAETVTKGGKASVRCLMCASDRLEPLYGALHDRSGLADGVYAFVRCAECGSATLDPQPPLASLASFYPENYTFKPVADGPLLVRLLRVVEWRALHRPIYRQRLAALRSLTGLGAGRVLEVGCGSGLFLRCLAAAGYEVEGLEISEADVAYARDHLGLRVRRGILRDLEPGRDRYDAVCFFAVLEHLPDPAAELARAFALLADGGWIVLEVPVIDSGQARLLGRRWHAVSEAPRHLMLPSCNGIERLLNGVGFRDVRCAPGPLVDNAGIIALSLVPGATASSAYGASGPALPLARRLAAALLVPPALVLAGWERRFGPGPGAGTMMFCARKPRS